MDLATYCVNAVLVEHRSHREVAAALGRSKSWVGNQVKRYERGGEAALVLQKRGPKVSPKRTAPELEDAIVTLRKHLSEEGFDAGARTISYHLLRQGLCPPALPTIHRVLTRRGFVTAQPQKRPRNSFIRFESDLPNECWQSDMTHWKLEGDRHIEVINFVDDHSRAVMASVVVRVAKAQDVVDVFYQAVERYGFPTSVLTDNGAIYTATYRGSHTGMEVDLARLGIVMKHGKPYHPQTQGKVERYHLTLKKWLNKQPLCDDIEQLQRQIDGFVTYYNEVRPHTARGCPPMQAWRQKDKAVLEIDGQKIDPMTRVRRDRVDKTGCVTLRYRSKLYHLGIGRAHRAKHVVILVADLDVRVIAEDGEVLSHITLDPTKNYQRQRLSTG